MAKPYRVNAFVRINNTMISSLLRLGIKVWSFSSLLVLPYLNVTGHSSLEEFEREVLAHPVFLVQPAM